MCTVSWHQTGDQFTVFFNRDERRERQPALPPAVHHRDGVSAIFPVDPEGGGTWLAVNNTSAVVCMLNYYETEDAGDAAQDSSEYESRGNILLHLLTSASRLEITRRLLKEDLNRYRPFHLLFLSEQDKHKWTWNQNDLLSEPLAPEDHLLTTSSLNPADVIGYRTALFKKQVQSLNDARAFHYRQDAEHITSSVRMEREDARTVSISEIQLTPGEVRFVYDDFTAPKRTVTLSVPFHPRNDLG